ncbi:hypothetical protein DH2020_008568 [Rehmannia glutinosa]|uniref:Peroxisomal membrane protein n=1 Tax=Rehmannia glutinosa TaxID=99300 RepID=A0ABR0X7F5_REHGL
MAAAVTAQSFISLSNPKLKPQSNKPFSSSKPQLPTTSKIFFKSNHYRRRSLQLVGSVANDLDVIPVQSDDRVDQQDGVVCIEREAEPTEVDQVVGGFGSEASGVLSFEVASGFSSAASSVGEPGSGDGQSQEEMERLIDRTINATIVLAAGSFAITKLLTIDHDYWHGWTLFEILRYAPQHNWIAYEEALKTNPVLAKMVISGVVYSVGDWIAQCYEGKPLFDFDRTRMFRSGLLGFTLHGSLSHYYYQFCEAGWKLWPFAHLITYGVIPVEQRLLWVDCVELIWVTILSTYSNEKSEARISEEAVEANASLPPSEV